MLCDHKAVSEKLVVSLFVVFFCKQASRREKKKVGLNRVLCVVRNPAYVSRVQPGFTAQAHYEADKEIFTPKEQTM